MKISTSFIFLRFTTETPNPRRTRNFALIGRQRSVQTIIVKRLFSGRCLPAGNKTKKLSDLFVCGEPSSMRAAQAGTATVSGRPWVAGALWNGKRIFEGKRISAPDAIAAFILCNRATKACQFGPGDGRAAFDHDANDDAEGGHLQQPLQNKEQPVGELGEEPRNKQPRYEGVNADDQHHAGEDRPGGILHSSPRSPAKNAKIFFESERISLHHEASPGRLIRKRFRSLRDEATPWPQPPPCRVCCAGALPKALCGEACKA